MEGNFFCFKETLPSASLVVINQHFEAILKVPWNFYDMKRFTSINQQMTLRKNFDKNDIFARNHAILH